MKERISGTGSRPNHVFAGDYQASRNFFESDLLLRSWLSSNLSASAREYMHPIWNRTGMSAAGEMNELSWLADKYPPVLEKRNQWGEDADNIRFHPAYDRLLEIAVDSQMFRVKWEPELREKYGQEGHALGFASGFLFAMTELSQFCPLCMTDGVARLIDLFAEDEDKKRLLPHIYTDKASDLYTGAMFLTEKAGGSDVGANLVAAEQEKGAWFRLNGEKWFCSNANAEIIFALARTNPEIKGTRGLSIFLIEKETPEGKRNPMNMIRLKDKLGVRSMASAEIILTDTLGKLVGEEQQGFPIMARMINLSRLYNSVAALAGARRALVEAYQFLRARNTFGRNALQHALIRDKLWELGSLQTANFYFTFRVIQALDRADHGDESETQLLRLLTPMLKKWTAEKGVYLVREAMELMGGMGYIEDTPLPRIMRDMMVLPIWEGAGNIMTLDMLRALTKSKGAEILSRELEAVAVANPDKAELIREKRASILEELTEMGAMTQDRAEVTGKYAFERLTYLYLYALVLKAHDPQTQAWCAPTAQWLEMKLTGDSPAANEPLSVPQIEGLMAWKLP